MKTNIYFWSYLAQFFLEWKMYQPKLVEKIKTHILRSAAFFFFRKSCRLCDNVEKCTTGQAANGNKHTHTHTQNMYYLLLFRGAR